MDGMIKLLKSDIDSVDVLTNVTRGIANFAKFPQNANRLVSYIFKIELSPLHHCGFKLNHVTIIDTL